MVDFRPIILFVSARLFLARVLRYPIFFYHLIKQPVTRSTQSSTMQKVVFEKSPRFSRTLRIILVAWTYIC